jgi:lipid II:glycine glycyltransferase (peptidoglycan interpeptide bridge formation enzyme)
LAIDLQRSDEALLGSFSARARRELRRADRFPLSVITIEDDALTPQLEQIHRETFARTGGRAPAQPWRRIAAAAREAPDRLRIFGLMLEDEGTAPRLVAFARVMRHGTFTVYDTAGSTRLEDRRIPLMYPVIWAQMRWARDTGAMWFDFGGVTRGSSQSEDDPVGGVSEFKRNFGGEELVIGEEWHFDAAPLRQRLVQSASKVLTFLKPDRQ